MRTIGLYVAAACAALSCPASAIVTEHIRPDTGSRIVINIHVGADRFYNAGFFGARAFIANVEAGHVWTGHETLSHGLITFDQHPSIDFPQRQYDGHATAVGFTMVGLGPYHEGIGYYYYQFGMAPVARLVSVAIATEWVGNSGEFLINTDTLVYGYRTPMQTGTWWAWFPGVSVSGQKVDIVNSSWGFDDPAGRAQETMVIDALAYANRQTVCLAAGNSGGPQVGGPASGYNSISVAALTSDLSYPAYSARAWFSSMGPNDFHNPVTGQTVPRARAAVDIAAPGTDLILAAYTGTTGSNTGGEDPFPGHPGVYYFGAAGTSFASPIVAGGAALLVDAGYFRFGGGQAIDGRVVKAVLMNSAAKTADWDNATVADPATGVLRTEQALDWAVGAGMLDLNRAYDQYLSGTTNVPGAGGGRVADIGWDFGFVAAGQPNVYLFNRAFAEGETFAATLDWFVNRRLDEQTNTAFDVAFSRLDLQLWTVSGQALDRLVAESAAQYNNVQHLYLSIPRSGYYAMRVVWAGDVYDVPGDTPDSEWYGLAWWSMPTTVIPAPLAACSAAVLFIGIVMRRRRTPADVHTTGRNR